jgi:hypothetical protein
MKKSLVSAFANGRGRGAITSYHLDLHNAVLRYVTFGGSCVKI